MGIDYSFAPFPDADKSIGGAMEALGFGSVGANGSLFVAGFLTDCLQRATFQKAGFNGLMLPVLEDSVLAKVGYSVQELLAYSAVCGIGLDTVPIPGNTSADAIAAIFLDTATLAIRLQKPLTARLMPIPDKKAGDEINFDFPFFADSHIMPVSPRPTIELTNQPPFTLNPFQKRE